MFEWECFLRKTWGVFGYLTIFDSLIDDDQVFEIVKHLGKVALSILYPPFPQHSRDQNMMTNLLLEYLSEVKMVNGRVCISLEDQVSGYFLR